MKISAINIITNQSPQQRAERIRKNYAPGRDTVDFKHDWEKSLYQRKTGDAASYFSDFEEAICKDIPILKNNQFGLKEYKQISAREKLYLRKLTECPHDIRDAVRGMKARTIKKDAAFLMKISNAIEKQLDKKYPEGYDFVGLGASAALFAKIREFKGKQSQLLPFSTEVLHKGEEVDFKKYFEKFGIEEGNTRKKVILDYKSAGYTFKKLEEILKENGLWSDNIKLESMTELIKDCIKEDDYHLMRYYFLMSSNIKSYAPCPEMFKKEQYDEIDSIDEKYNWNIATKLMSFAILDQMNKKLPW